jgi:hypothetical protein
VDDEAVLGLVGGGFALAAAIGALLRARMARSHRRAGDFLAWSAVAGVLGLVAVSLFLAPGAWADAYGALLRLVRGDEE